MRELLKFFVNTSEPGETIYLDYKEIHDNVIDDIFEYECDGIIATAYIINEQSKALYSITKIHDI